MAEELMNPCGVYRYEDNPLAPRPAHVRKKVLGLVDNSKSNADHFLDRVQEVLNQTYCLAEIQRIKKSSGAVPAPFTPEFFERCDVAVNAFGD